MLSGGLKQPHCWRGTSTLQDTTQPTLVTKTHVATLNGRVLPMPISLRSLVSAPPITHFSDSESNEDPVGSWSAAMEALKSPWTSIPTWLLPNCPGTTRHCRTKINIKITRKLCETSGAKQNKSREQGVSHLVYGPVQSLALASAKYEDLQRAAAHHCKKLGERQHGRELLLRLLPPRRAHSAHAHTRAFGTFATNATEIRGSSW